MADTDARIAEMAQLDKVHTVFLRQYQPDTRYRAGSKVACRIQGRYLAYVRVYTGYVGFGRCNRTCESAETDTSDHIVRAG